MENLHPNESLKIIENIISERRQKYEQNGMVFILWGVLIVLSSLVNIFTKSSVSWALLMPLGGILTFIYFYREGKKAKQKGMISDWTGWVWFVAGFCAMYFGFVLVNHLGVSVLNFLNALIYLPFSFAALSSALYLKNRLWVFTSILAIFVLFCEVSFGFSHWKIKVMIPAIEAILLFLVPGIQFYLEHKKRNNV